VEWVAGGVGQVSLLQVFRRVCVRADTAWPYKTLIFRPVLIIPFKSQLTREMWPVMSIFIGKIFIHVLYVNIYTNILYLKRDIYSWL
jgi:hypothetical protein